MKTGGVRLFQKGEKKQVVSVRMHSGQNYRTQNRLKRATDEEGGTDAAINPTLLGDPNRETERERATQKDRLTDEGPCPV